MNIRINLLPHREMRRERRKKEFMLAAAFVAVAAAAAAFGVGMVIDRQIEVQRARNAFISTESARLDAQIREIATLRAEIEALRARQAAVETLQSDRTIPVHLVDELVRQMPEGAFLRSMRQDDRKLTLVGFAQSNERISDLLRALANDSPWLERPELIEIKAVTPAALQAGKTGARDPFGARRVYEFSINAMIRRADTDPAPDTGKAAPAAKRGQPGAGASAHAPGVAPRN